MIVAAGYMLYRRLFTHPPRLVGLGPAEQRFRQAPHQESIVILVFIVLIMIGGLLDDAGYLVAYNVHGNERDLAPLAGPLAAALGGLSRSSAQTVFEIGWWMHCVTVLVFLNLLPLSKHFHIITSLPNVFFGKLPPRSPDRPLAITHGPAAPMAALDGPPEGLIGVSSLADLTWKQVLDSITCTECGRCSAVCPATASGTPLAPRQLVLDLRERLYHRNSGNEPLDLGRGALVVHDLHGLRGGLSGRDRARADDRRHAPQAGGRRSAGSAASADARELRQAGQLVRQVLADAGALDPGARLPDPRRSQGAR